MAANDELTPFVREALARGVSRDDIRKVLLEAGWNVDQISVALKSYADVAFPIPVPRPKAYLNAREAFMYLVQFVTLYTSAYNLGALLFDIINWKFPDPALAAYSASQPNYLREAIRWEVSSLLVAFPVFLFVCSMILRGIARDPAKRQSRIRRQLTYVTLFVASLALIGDVTTLVYNALGGELETRIVLKGLVVAVIAGAAFWYYLTDLRREEAEPAP